MKHYYLSLTMGNIVDTKREVFKQIVESLICYRTLDIRWRKCKYSAELCGGY